MHEKGQTTNRRQSGHRGQSIAAVIAHTQATTPPPTSQPTPAAKDPPERKYGRQQDSPHEDTAATSSTTRHNESTEQQTLHRTPPKTIRPAAHAMTSIDRQRATTGQIRSRSESSKKGMGAHRGLQKSEHPHVLAGHLQDSVAQRTSTNNKTNRIILVLNQSPTREGRALVQLYCSRFKSLTLCQNLSQCYHPMKDLCGLHVSGS